MPVNFENLLANSVIRSAFLESWSCENCSKIGNDSIYIMQHCDHGVCVSCLDRAQLKGMINTGEKSHFFPCPVDACSRKFSILERDLNFMGNAIMSPPWFRVTMENQLKTIVRTI